MDDHSPKSVIGGLACRMPMSRNSTEFWENLITGKDMINRTHWPPGLYGLPPRIGALLELENFDNSYFEIPDDEANQMNPMLRHLLEVIYECVVDSGLPLSELQQTKTGIYLACFGSDTDFTETSRELTANASVSSYLVGGIAKNFGLTGPAICVDTACSSSAAALNMAVNELVAGKCTFAVVAACNLVINPLFSQQMFVLGMLSKEGISSVFDEAANGYVRADGCAALLLARNADFLPRAYCHVVDIAVGCDGYKKEGITNPNPKTQAALMMEVYKRSGINVNDVHYVEAHGTGTQVGDTAETAAITEVFCEDRNEPLLIGSVKSNMGHSEATSALASIIKVILMMHHDVIPANLNYKNPNPGIAGIHSNKLKVVDKCTPLKGNYVGINSFGFGGVNGHIILEPFHEEKNKDEYVHVTGHVMVPITARNRESFQNIVDFVNNNRYNSTLLRTLSESQLSCDEELPLRGYIQIGPEEDDFHVHCKAEICGIPNVCLCLDDFMGSYITVHKDFFEIECFMMSLTDCSKSIKRMDPTLDIIALLRKHDMFLPHTRTGMLIATAILISMHTLLEEANLGYSKIMGCGLTEIVGAYIDGCLTLDMCFNVINCIGKHVEEFAKNNSGRWLLCDVQLNCDLLYQLGPGTMVLTINRPDMGAVSIETKYKDKVLEKKIHTAGGYYDLLPTSVPVYSVHMKETSEKIKKELRDIIPSPVFRSPQLLSAQTGWHCGVELENRRVLFDADYISKIICKPVNIASKLLHKPADSLYLRMLPTARPSLDLRRIVCDLNASHMTDHSDLLQNQSMKSFSAPGGGKSMRYDSLSAGSGLDYSEHESSYSIEEEYEDIPFVATADSLCRCLGKLHMQGHQLNVSLLYSKPEGPLDITCPSLSPLVSWDHSVSWNIPHWLEFSCREKDEVNVYEIELDTDKTIQAHLAMVLYHTWKAIMGEKDDIQEKTDGTLQAIKLTNLHIPNKSLLTNGHIDGAVVHVHRFTEIFAVISAGEVLLQGDFEIKESFPLPHIPEYDLDYDDSVPPSPKESEPVCQKTEIEWEDSWLDFLSDMLEFSNQCSEAPLLELIINPMYHLKEAKECPNFLAVAERYTGICRSGGVLLQHELSLAKDVQDFSLNRITVSNPSQTLVTKVMVYKLYSHRKPDDYVILYEANKDTEMPHNKVGIININGKMLITELPEVLDWVPEDLEALIPYLLAAYILYGVAKIRTDQTLLILPPIDTVGVYMISLGVELGCSVFACTYDMENLQCLESTFPHIRVINGSNLEESLMSLTHGKGVDVCIRLSAAGGIQLPMQLLAKSGQFIQCIPLQHGDCLIDSRFTKSKSLRILGPLDSVSWFMNKSAEDQQGVLYNQKGEAISKLTMEGFPESKGVLYSRENTSNFLQPIPLDKLLSLVMEPNLGNVEDLLEADLLCIEKIQGLVAPKPKDYSLADTSCIQRNPFEEQSSETLNTGMMQTPMQPQDTVDASNFSPDVSILNIYKDSLSMKKCSPVVRKKQIKPEDSFQTTSTPLNMEPLNMFFDGEVKKIGQLEESYVEHSKQRIKGESISIQPVIPKVKIEVMADSPIRKVRKPPCKVGSAQKGHRGLTTRTGTPASKITPAGSFRKMMKDRSKVPPPKLELLKPKLDIIISSPMTPMTPALKDILTPKYVQNLVPLNNLKADKERPLFIVHPITGATTLLNALGGKLIFPCYGIQRTINTPSDSVNSVANFYINAIQMVQPSGPYRISGYSFGTIVALEIAKQLQAQQQKVEKLIFLDGSPLYVQAQIGFVVKHLPEHATSKQVEESLEAGALVNWMSLFGPVVDRDLRIGVLRKLPTFDDRLNTAVAMTFQEVKVSRSPQVTKWLAIKEKVLKQSSEKKSNFADAALELMRFKRKEKAADFVTHVKMAWAYRCSSKFMGDIYLHRIKSDPMFESLDIPLNYGLESQCTGEVHLKMYEGNHDTFLTKGALIPLAKDINEVLGIKN